MAILLNLVFFGGAGFLESLKGFGVGIAIFFVPFMLGAMGGGDVKMLGMIGAFKGIHFVVGTALYGVLAGGILAVVSLIKHGQLGTTLKRVGWTFRSWIAVFASGVGIADLTVPEQEPITPYALPYGVAISIGVVLALVRW